VCSLAQSPIISSSSAWFSPRAACVAKRSSSPSSGRPISSASRRHSVSWLAAITTHVSSFDRYTLDGATRGRIEPLGSRTAPHFSYSGTADSSIATQASAIEASTTWPLAPRASRAYRASTMPWNADCAASVSPSEIPGRGGAWPG
jgi:hypothetical protein